MNRPRDLSFEALVEVTGASISSERGALNAALKQMREEMPDTGDEELAAEIVRRSDLYKKAYPAMALTPTALAKHWWRVNSERPSPWPDEEPNMCGTCRNDRFVLVRKRPAEAEGLFFEEYAACPDCASGTAVDYWRSDGTRFRAPDPAQVRQMMNE